MNLKNIRENLGLKQKYVAESIGVTPTTLSRYETGERTPDLEILKKLSKLYNVSVDMLIGNEYEISSSDKDELDEKIIKIFGSLSEADQAQILDYARYLLMREKQDT